MKKFLLLAAAFFAVLGCEEENKNITPEKVDKISVMPTEKIVGNIGGSFQVMVSSSAEWTLNTKDGKTLDWVSTDKISGADGDLVKFEVKANEDVEKKAVFVFTCGKASADFSVTSLPAELPVITLASEQSLERNWNSGKFTIEVNLDKLTKDDLRVQASADWLRHLITLEGETATSARLDFEFDKSSEREAREATITISAEKAEPVTINFKQTPEAVLAVSPNSFKLGAEAGVIEFTVDTNVEYEISMSEGSDWLTDHKTEGNIEKWSYSALTNGGARNAVITLTQKNAPADIEAKTTQVRVKQTNAIISTAAYMKDHCAGAPEGKWKSPEVLKLGKNFTIECLVRHDKDFKEGDWGNAIGTLFGIERRILVRHGDNSRNVKEWELVYVLNRESWGEKVEMKIQSKEMLPAEEWVHIAVVFNESTNAVLLYQNGQIVGSDQMDPDMMPVDLTESYYSNGQTQAFYLGRSYSKDRSFWGMMSEVRVWNRPLGTDELQAENHFYTVPTDSEGLVAYWKMDDGVGTTIRDYTKNANDLSYEYWSGNGWEPHSEWRDVELP